MKKISFLLALFCAVITLSATAQSNTPNPLRFGARAALNLSLFTGSNPFNNGPYDSGFRKYVRPCIALGLTADYAITPAFALGAELEYNQRGGAYRQENGDVVLIDNYGRTSTGYNYFHFIVNYLELPLLAKYDVSNPAARTGFVIYGGVSPSVTVGTGTKYTDYEGDYIAKTRSASDDLNNVRTFNASGTFGFQIVGKQSARNWYADIRGSYTFLPVFSDLDGGYNTNMFTGSIGVGLKF